MSIKTQKIVRFIPFVNFFVTFFSLIKSYRSSKQAKVGDILKIVLTMFVSILLINLPKIILSGLINNEMINTVISLVTAYVTLVVISTIAIIQQEKYMLNDNE